MLDTVIVVMVTACVFWTVFTLTLIAAGLLAIHGDRVEKT